MSNTTALFCGLIGETVVPYMPGTDGPCSMPGTVLLRACSRMGPSGSRMISLPTQFAAPDHWHGLCDHWHDCAGAHHPPACTPPRAACPRPAACAPCRCLSRQKGSLMATKPSSPQARRASPARVPSTTPRPVLQSSRARTSLRRRAATPRACLWTPTSTPMAASAVMTCEGVRAHLLASQTGTGPAGRRRVLACIAATLRECAVVSAEHVSVDT